MNEVGFVTTAGVNPVFKYQITGGLIQNADFAAERKDSNDVVWYTLPSPVQMNTGDSVKLFNYDGNNNAVAFQFDGGFLPWTSSYAGVTFGGFTNTNNEQSLAGTVGNIRVSPANPGSNVAPEPGSIALLLTGGGALAGIALRRRRNAS